MHNEALKEEADQLILKFWRRPEFRDTVTSDRIYRAVFESGLTNVSDFERFVSSQ